MKLTKIEKMKEVDIRTVDASVLEDIDKIEIKRELPVEERWLDFVRKVKNPFCFICNGMVIKTSYTETEENLENKLVRLCLEMDGI